MKTSLAAFVTAPIACPVPAPSLLVRYVREGAFVDCYVADLALAVSHAEYVETFYTSRVFAPERLILKWLVSRPSTDVQARQLGEGAIDAFAAWQVEGRSSNELLLADFSGRTRSWLMTEPLAGAQGTRLYFGSAVVPIRDRKTGRTRMGAGFHALLWFHRLYSKALLASARSRLRSRSA